MGATPGLRGAAALGGPASRVIGAAALSGLASRVSGAAALGGPASRVIGAAALSGPASKVRGAAALSLALLPALWALPPGQSWAATAATGQAAQSTPAPARAPAPRATAAPRNLGCLIEPDRVADVGAQVVGVVESMAVERGDRVVAGQPLLKLAAGVERAAVDVAQSRAQVDAEVRAAQASVTLAEQKMQRNLSLQAQKFVSSQAVEQSKAELELAEQKHKQTQSQQRIWGDERRVAEAQLALRTVRSPFAGVVTERFVNLGERVEEKPLLRIAVIDPLRVELMLPSPRWGSLKAGDRVMVQPELPGAQPVAATVRHIDSVLDAASNSFRVRLSLPNPHYRLPAGLRCTADLQGADPGAQAGVAPMPATPPGALPPLAARATP